MSKYLYNYDMHRMGDIFSSKARTEILRVLCCQSRGIGLRKTARLAGVHPHSAELVLNSLQEEKLARSKRVGNRRLFELNRGHEDFPLLQAVFEAAARAAIKKQSETLNARAASVLPFIREASKMLKRAKRDLNVTGKTV